MTENEAGINLKPLSSVRYFLNNKRRSLSMAVAIAASVVLVMIFQIVFNTVIQSHKFAISGRLDHMTVVYPGDSGKISGGVMKKISDCTDVDREIPIVALTTDYYHFFGNLNIPVYFVGKDNIPYIIDKLGLKLVEGRVPEEGKKEVLLDQRTARNKGKELGDFIGRQVDRDERMPGRYKIVGILKGDCLVGLGTMEQDKLQAENGMLLFPVKGRLDSMNRIFEGVREEEAYASTKEYGKSVFKDDRSMFDMISVAIIGIAIFIMSFAAGNSSYAQYFSRRYEFGTLQSIGYSRAGILLRAAREIVIVNAAGFILGIIMVVLLASILKVSVFDPKGYPFVMMRLEGFMKALIIPVCTVVFSLIPAWWTLSKVDPMEVVEKFE